MSGVAAWCPRNQCWEAATATDAWALLQRRTVKRKGPEGSWGPLADQCNGAVWVEVKETTVQSSPRHPWQLAGDLYLTDTVCTHFSNYFLYLVCKILVGQGQGHSLLQPSAILKWTWGVLGLCLKAHEGLHSETDSDPTFLVPCWTRNTRNAQSRVGICLKTWRLLRLTPSWMGRWVSWVCQEANYLGIWGFNPNFRASHWVAGVPTSREFIGIWWCGVPS